MLRGYITAILNNNIHVCIPEIHSDKLIDTDYPVCSMCMSYGMNLKQGDLTLLKKGQWCWFDFEKGDKHMPVMIGLIYETQDIPMYDATAMKIISNKQQLIQILETVTGLKIKLDCDVDLKTATNYTGLYATLNELQKKLNEVIIKINTLALPVVNNTAVNQVPMLVNKIDGFSEKV